MKTRTQTIQFFLVRHGESAANVGGTVGGNSVPLTDEGLKQSAVLGEYFAQMGYVFDAAWHSTLPRAVQTFQELSRALSPEQLDAAHVFPDKRIIERQHGAWEGKPSKEIWTSTEIARMNQLGADYATPGGESFRDVERRTDLWLQDTIKIARSREKDRVLFLVVSHGHALRCLVAPLLGLSSHTYWRMSLDNTSITGIHWADEHGWFLDCWNSCPHLGRLTLSHCFGGFFVCLG